MIQFQYVKIELERTLNYGRRWETIDTNIVFVDTCICEIPLYTSFRQYEPSVVQIYIRRVDCVNGKLNLFHA